MKVWIELRTEKDRAWLDWAVKNSCFGVALSCCESPVNPHSLNVNFREFPIDHELIAVIPGIVDWDYYEDGLYDEFHPMKVQPMPTRQLPDLRRGRVVPFRKTS